MSDTVSIRRFAAHEWRIYRDLRLRSLEDSPDAFGSTLAHEQKRSDAQWAARLASGASSATDSAFVAELRGEAVGLVWGWIDPPNSDTAHLYQMWVAPTARGSGAGRMLLDGVIAWARSTHVRRLALGVTLGDSPANRLYARAGFTPDGAPAPIRPESEVLGRPMQLLLDAPGRPRPQ